MTDNASPFSEMAESIKHNEGQGFGGACVIMPPGEGAEPISILILDSSQDVAQFLALIQTRCKLALDAIEDKQRQTAAGFGRR